MKIVTFRNKRDADLIGILVDQKDDYVVIEHPFFIQFNPMNGNVAMAPFCVFSDQTQFKFLLKELQFVVPVREPVAKHFVKMVKSLEEDDVFASSTVEEDKSEKTVSKHLH